MIAALANFVGAFAAVGGVAKTIGADIAGDPATLTQTVVMAAQLAIFQPLNELKKSQRCCDSQMKRF